MRRRIDTKIKMLRTADARSASRIGRPNVRPKFKQACRQGAEGGRRPSARDPPYTNRPESCSGIWG
jgi:hypothetical protein